MLRALGIVVLVVLLGVNTAAANAVIVMDRTVLDPDFVRQGLESESAYQDLSDSAVSVAGSGSALEADGVGTLGLDRTRVIEDALPPSYLEAQTEANIDRTYAYLSGERNDLVIAFDPAPVRERAAGSVESQIGDTPSASLLGELVGDESIDVDGTTVDLGVLWRMAESEPAYHEARSSVRADVRVAVIDEYGTVAFRSASNDELLALVIEDYDPSAYSAAEKADLVASREGAIRDRLRERIVAERGDEIESAVDERLSVIRDEANSRATELAASSVEGTDEEVADAATAMVRTSVDGLTTDLAYDEYESRLDADKARFAASTGAVAGELVASQLPAAVAVTAELPRAERQRLETVRSGVQATPYLVIGLPLLGLVFLGALWWVSRSRAVTAGGAGGALFIGALPGLVIANQLPVLARAAFSGEDLAGLSGVFIGLAERAVGVLFTQSLVIAGVGVVLAAAGVLLYPDDRGAISLPLD